MRTGAIFARGSCRALKWMALLGMVFVLGVGTAAAQITTTVPTEVDEGATVRIAVGGTVPANTGGTPDIVTISFGAAAGTATATATAAEPNDWGDVSDTLVINRPAGGTTPVPVSGNLVWTLGRDPGTNAEDEVVDLTFTASVGVFASGAGSATVTIKDTDTQSYVLSGETSITEGAAAATTLTLVASPLKTVDVTGIAFGMTPNDPTKYTLGTPSGTTLAAGGSVTVTIQALPDGNRADDPLTVTAYGGTPLATLDTLDISVKDIHTLPAAAAITAVAYDEMTGGNMVTSVEEGDEVYIEVVVNRGTSGYPDGEMLEVTLGLSDASLGTFDGTGKVDIASGSGEKKGTRVKLDTVAMNSFPQAGTLVVSLTASGKTAANGSGSVTGTPLSLGITDATETRIWALEGAQDAIYAAMNAAKGSDGKLNPNDDFSVSNSMLFGTMTGYNASVKAESSTTVASTDDSGDRVMVMPDSAGTAKITITGTAVPSASSFQASQLSTDSAQIMFEVMVDAATPVAPGRPPGLDADEGDQMVTLTWRAPTTGDTPTGYEFRSAVDNRWSDWDDTSSMTAHTVTGLTNGAEYTFEVRAVAGEVKGAAASVKATPMAPRTRAKRGQITKFELIGAGEEKTIGGVTRLFVDEGEQRLELSVTVRWSNEEIHEIGYDRDQVILVVIKEDRAAGPPSGAGNWLSWIDAEGDVHFPQSIRGNSGWGNLGGWVVVKTPKESAIPRAERRSSRHFTDSMPGKLPVLVLHDNHEAENDAFYIEAEHSPFADVDLDATAAVNKITPEVVIDDDEEQKVTVKGPTSVYESDKTAEFTLGADPQRVELPLDVALQMLDLEGVTVSAAQISVSDASVQIGTGASAPKVTVHLPASDGNREDDDYQMQASVNLYSLTSGGFDTIAVKSAPIKVVDVHKLPWLTVSPASGTVAEGGTLDLTLKVNRNPANTIATDPEKRQYTSEALTIAVTAGGNASSSDFTMTPSSISVDEYKHTAAKNWMQEVKVTIAASADEDIDAETLMLDFVVNGTKAENGPRPDGDMNSAAQANLTIQDATATLVSVRENAYDVIKGALGDPPMLTTGKSAELMGVNLFNYDSAAVSVVYATSVEGGAVTASASGGTVTIMGATAGEAKVTITATASPTASSLDVNQTKANVAQMTFPVMVEDEDLVFSVEGPDDRNLSEGGMGGMVTVTTNRPVTANTEVMLMRDGSSSASDDDYMLDPPLVTIMAGKREGHTMVMATEDSMAEEMEMLTLFLVVDGMQMTDKSVSFYIWDAAVPALPIIAQLLLAAFLALGGYRRYLRR